MGCFEAAYRTRRGTWEVGEHNEICQNFGAKLPKRGQPLACNAKRPVNVAGAHRGGGVWPTFEYVSGIAKESTLKGSCNIQWRREASVLLPVDNTLLSASAGSALRFLWPPGMRQAHPRKRTITKRLSTEYLKSQSAFGSGGSYIARNRLAAAYSSLIWQIAPDLVRPRDLEASSSLCAPTTESRRYLSGDKTGRRE